MYRKSHAGGRLSTISQSEAAGVLAFDVLKRITSHPANRGKKLEAIIRFAKWQVASRLIVGDVVHDWVNGSRFLVRAGETGLTGNIYAGLHEFSDMGFLLHFLRPQDLFVDVGANSGSYSILAGKAVGARGYAFEPVPASYTRLVENMRLNHLEHTVKCFNVAVGKSDGTVEFTAALDTENHVIANGEPHENTLSIQVTTLDRVLRDENPTLLKIDVEGYETPVLEGATECLRKSSILAVIMELNGLAGRYGFQESAILQTMLANGFETYTYDPFARQLISLDGKLLNLGNTIFVRDKNKILERLASAPCVVMSGRRF